MSHRQKAPSRVLLAVLAAVFGVLAMPASPAQAQVSIVPDHVDGGGTRTFAFRVANERTDTEATRLELVFPQENPIAYVDVAPVPGWSARVVPRPVDPPIQADGEVVREVAASLVFEGGVVAPRQFETFLVTMGPLPADGRLAFEATQTYADGAVSRWNSTTSPAPAIAVGTGTLPTPAVASDAADPAGAREATIAGDDAAPAPGGSAAGPPFAVLWTALALAFVVIALVGFQAHRRKVTTAPAGDDLLDDLEDTEDTVDTVDRAGEPEVSAT